VAAIAALLDSRPAVAALRRGLLKDGPGVVSCRGAAALRRTLNHRVVEAVVLAPRPGILQEFSSLRADFPAIPVIAYAAFRPDDGELLALCHQHHVAAVVVEGVDDAVIGDLVRRASLAAERYRALAHAPRLLRLTEPLQIGAWETLVEQASQPQDQRSRKFRLGARGSFEQSSYVVQAHSEVLMLSSEALGLGARGPVHEARGPVRAVRRRGGPGRLFGLEKFVHQGHEGPQQLVRASADLR